MADRRRDTRDAERQIPQQLCRKHTGDTDHYVLLEFEPRGGFVQLARHAVAELDQLVRDVGEGAVQLVWRFGGGPVTPRPNDPLRPR